MKTYTLNILRDEEPQSPREWDNLGIMACKHRRYELGDKKHSGQNFTFEDFDSWKECEEYARKELGALVVLPLYLYDHSGITMKTTPFGCNWDSEQVGIIYTTKAKCDEMGNDAEDLERLKDLLIDEVKIYDQYLTGDVWGYVIKEVETCNLEHEHEKIIDSCWGFYSKEEAKEQGESATPKNK